MFRVIYYLTVDAVRAEGPYESVTTVYPPSDRRVEFVALWTGKDIPAGIPLSPKLSLLGLNMRFLDVFLFSWVKWTRSPVGIFLLSLNL
jgi:hypothetical protein